MAYEFMREFTGVPLQQTDAERRRGLIGFLAGGMTLLLDYAEHLSSATEGPRAIVSLNLHHEGGGELLTVDGVLTQRGLLDANIALIGLSGATRASHRYGIDAQNTVTRTDHADLDAQQAMDLPDFRELIERMRAVQEGAEMERPKEPQRDVDMSAFGALTRDAVTLDEINGLRTHFEQKMDSNLYVPIDDVQALRLQGLGLE